MKKRNFLLGRGERLAEPVRIPTGPVDKLSPYTFAETKERLQPMLNNLAEKINKLSNDVCPEGNTVAVLTLNPEFIAKSYYPDKLLRTLGLETIGSRKKIITPEKKSKDRKPTETTTTELFVKGHRNSFLRWASEFPTWNESDANVQQIMEIEEINFPDAETKVKTFEDNGAIQVFEVVLQGNDDFSEVLFKKYLNKLGLDPSFERRFYVGGLSFFEIAAPSELVEDIAKFSLVRIIRKMPELRLLRPTFRSTGVGGGKVDYHNLEPVNKNLKVAIFDGGVPEDHPICQWTTPYEFSDCGPATEDLLEHGISVTSAFLFGHLNPSQSLPQPYSYVDHYRVLDDEPGQNPYELYEVLNRIDDVLSEEKYEFINLSIGPCLPIDDDEVHAWTAVIDRYLSTGNIVATIAVGNDGEGDSTINANRIQVPSDCVNGLAIGACDVPDNNWQRATYSSVGPGRSPGLMKPDLVDFGGSLGRPFLSVGADGIGYLQTGGTSFAAPSVLRISAGIKAHFGNSLGSLAIRTLLIHSSESSLIPKSEVGWGRVARDLDSIVLCDDHIMRVVFQGKITASKYLRAPIPLPLTPIDGMVNIKATLCYATNTDPHHPNNYTRSGLEVFMRPNKNRKNKVKYGNPEPMHASTKPFFGEIRSNFSTENELRNDAFKWENCLHAEKRMRGTSLNEPVFDIHYNARSEGHSDTKFQELNYALIITVEAPKVPDLYDRIVRRYATQLEQIQPIIDIPLRISE
ncbi:Subtilase family protein [Elizabethkingia miricola]|nr:Subtilase family protein [Elizabethkingia miricola]